MELKATLTLVGLGLAGLGFGGAVLFGVAAWHRRTSQTVEQLLQPHRRSAAKTVSFTDLESLPAPVFRYFRAVLQDGQPLIRSARIIQAGEFRTRQTANGWSRFEATQYFSAAPPGMVWDARIRMAPLLDVRVRDMYLAGQGSMQAKILALVPVLDEHDKAELDAGALQRYLAEAAWMPTALLPSEQLHWSAIDERSALATLTDSGITVSLAFHFNAGGEIAHVFTPARYRAVGGTYELTPWAGHFRHYEARDGMRLPVEGEVEWQLPDGHFSYCKLRIVSAEYAFAR